MEFNRGSSYAGRTRNEGPLPSAPHPDEADIAYPDTIPYFPPREPPPPYPGPPLRELQEFEDMIPSPYAPDHLDESHFTGANRQRACDVITVDQPPARRSRRLNLVREMME